MNSQKKVWMEHIYSMSQQMVIIDDDNDPRLISAMEMVGRKYRTDPMNPINIYRAAKTPLGRSLIRKVVGLI